MSKPSIVWIGAGISSIALAVCLSCAPLAAQSESQADQQNAPPASIQQEPNDQGSPLAPPAQGPAQGASQANQAAPSRLTLSTGTVLAVRTI